MAVSRTGRACAARRRRQRLGLVVNDLTEVQWAAIQEAWAGCAYCGTPGASMQRHCVLPVLVERFAP